MAALSTCLHGVAPNHAEDQPLVQHTPARARRRARHSRDHSQRPRRVRFEGSHRARSGTIGPRALRGVSASACGLFRRHGECSGRRRRRHFSATELRRPPSHSTRSTGSVGWPPRWATRGIGTTIAGCCWSSRQIRAFKRQMTVHPWINRARRRVEPDLPTPAGSVTSR
jgi:hypothetical protein